MINLLELAQQIKTARLDLVEIKKKMYVNACTKAIHEKTQSEIKLQYDQAVIEDKTLTNPKSREIALKNMLSLDDEYSKAVALIKIGSDNEHDLEIKKRNLKLEVEYLNNLLLISDIQTRSIK